ncbi:ATP-binding protein [Arthrobacter sp. OVS8]|nr:ATP-binding protein [Arthrobacter sp. OVS8]
MVFIDEVEEIAAQRSGEPPSPLQGVTNELLKIIPAFREQPGRLLVCATNFIRALDSAFLRHGRFDYVIPIGLPDRQAREAMWQRFIPATVVDDVDVELLVDRTEGFSPPTSNTPPGARPSGPWRKRCTTTAGWLPAATPPSAKPSGRAPRRRTTSTPLRRPGPR